MTNPTPHSAQLPPHGALPEPFIMAHEDAGAFYPSTFSSTQVQEYAEAYAREALRAQAASAEPVGIWGFVAEIPSPFGQNTLREVHQAFGAADVERARKAATAAYSGTAYVTTLNTAPPDHAPAPRDSSQPGELSDEVILKYMQPWIPCDPCHQDTQDVIAAIRALVAHIPADVGAHTLTVWFGPMPESNGRENWTVVLRRKERPTSAATKRELHHLMSGFTVCQSEYKDRMRYEADRLRFLLGEIDEDPHILDYDADLRSGYVAPQPQAVAASSPATATRYFKREIGESQDWQPCSHEEYVAAGRDPHTDTMADSRRDESPAEAVDAAKALQEIADWNSHTAEFAVDYGSNGVRDFYRSIARAALQASRQPVTQQGGGEALSDPQIDALDTFSLSTMAPRGKESVRAFARAVIDAHLKQGSAS